MLERVRLLLPVAIILFDGVSREHQWLALASLICFSFYLPLSTMIGPLLVETPSDPGKVLLRV